MQDRFDRCLDGLLPGEGGAVLLAVSGGIDSMVMADLFCGSSSRPRVSVAHCNFHLRGAESDADAAFVRDWAASKGIPVRVADFDTTAYSEEKGISIEMAARELRYGWFLSMAREEGFEAVATAHNLGDNAETLVLNLLRGTGLKGICGMKASSPLMDSEVLLIRPMLGFSRKEIHEYALSRGIRWREDSTNADSAYKRNLVRNEIFPLFEHINPSFLETLEADMKRFSQVREVADSFVESHFPDVAEGDPSTDAGLRIDVDKLQEVPSWEYLLYRLLEPYGFNEAVTEDLAALVRDGGSFSGRRFHSKDYVAVTSRGSIVVKSREGALAGKTSGQGADDAAGQCVVEGPGDYSFAGTRFVVDEVEVADPRQPEGITVAAVGFPFTVRRWQPGDWMRPLGMRGRRKKLSDMFTDLKFSIARKEEALVIADEGSHVLALVGYRIDESVAIPVGELAEPPARAMRIRLI